MNEWINEWMNAKTVPHLLHQVVQNIVVVAKLTHVHCALHDLGNKAGKSNISLFSSNNPNLFPSLFLLVIVLVFSFTHVPVQSAAWSWS